MGIPHGVRDDKCERGLQRASSLLIAKDQPSSNIPDSTAMPLTFAHPAAVLPLRRLRLPFSALVVGSFSPDLIYFIRLAPRGHFGHTLPGLFLFCLPAGFVFLWVFHQLLKHPLTELAPTSVQKQLVPYLRQSPFDRRALPIATAILLGALTHIAWDAFTHEGGWGLTLFPVLSHQLSVGTLVIPSYKLAQHGSTVLGFALLAYSFARWRRRTSEVSVDIRLTIRSRLFRLGLLLSSSLIVGIIYSLLIAIGSTSPLPVFVGRLVISTTSSLFIMALVYSAWISSQKSA